MEPDPLASLPPPTGGARAGRRRVLLVLAVWTAVALVVWTQALVRTRVEERPAPWHALALFQLAYWYGWALCTPLVFALGRRLAFPAGRRLGAILRVTGAGLLISFAMLAWFTWLVREVARQGGDEGFWSSFQGFLFRGLHHDLLILGAILAAGLALDYHALFRERALRAARLETRLVRAQLDVLRMQLRPHFLFNTLNAVSSLVEDDPPGARRMLARLSELLRLTLEVGDREEVPLREELGMLERYLEIERCRFEERLSVRSRIAPDCLDAAVPPLLLQPLVENSVRHGTEAGDGSCRIEIEARRDPGGLELSVRDHGPGPAAERRAGASPGIGLANIRGRLEQMYPGRASLELEACQGGGTRAVLRLPFVGPEASPA